MTPQAHARPKRGPKRWPAPTRPAAPGSGGRVRRGVLGLAWVNGVFCSGVYRRQNRIAGWIAPEPVNSLEAFATALDHAIGTLGFRGVEAFLILDHPDLSHQLEQAPGFSEKAAKTYLKNLMRRRAETGEPIVWAHQRTIGDRRQSSYLVHQMPRRLYDAINGILLERHLELARIHPFSVPVQEILLKHEKKIGEPLLIACHAGTTTNFAVGDGRGGILFSRTTMSTWETNPERIALEINRSLLYAKQQFGTPVGHILLAGIHTEAAAAVVQQKCPGEQTIHPVLATPLHWLDAARGLARKRDVNLLARYLRLKQRNRVLRMILLGAGWLTLASVAFNLLGEAEAWKSERSHLENLAAVADDLIAEHARLSERNDRAAHAEAFLQAVTNGTLAPVPGKFLVYLSDILPREARLSELSVKWNSEENAWHFTCEGTMQVDEETARQAEVALRKQLANGPFKARLLPGTPRGTTMSFGTIETDLSRFSMEGDIDEN